jgi:hypothetical protein
MALVKIKGSFALLFASSCDHHKFAVLFPHLAVVCFQGCQLYRACHVWTSTFTVIFPFSARHRTKIQTTLKRLRLCSLSIILQRLYTFDLKRFMFPQYLPCSSARHWNSSINININWTVPNTFTLVCCEKKSFTLVCLLGEDDHVFCLCSFPASLLANAVLNVNIVKLGCPRFLILWNWYAPRHVWEKKESISKRKTLIP